VSKIVLDTGALIALERHHRQSALDLRVAVDAGVDIAVPAGCVAQAWRDGSQQVELARVLKSRNVRTVALDRHVARRIGELLRRTGSADVIDAHVAVVAMRDDRTIFTSDVLDLRALAPRARIEPV
jgi:predicted nucleic acid-binding protein